MNEVYPGLGAGIANAFDTVLPFEPYKPKLLDFMLISEAELSARVRVNQAIDILENEKINPYGLCGKLEMLDIYEEYHPDINIKDDLELYNVENTKNKNEEITYRQLAKYASLEACSDIGNKFFSKYQFTANKALEFIRTQKMTQSNGKKYLSATLNFTHKLFELDFIYEDELLRKPLIQLGEEVCGCLELEENIKGDWDRYLENVIMHENLIGEDGLVMEDITASLIEWVNYWFSHK